MTAKKKSSLLHQIPFLLILFRFLSGPVLWWNVVTTGGNVSRPFWPTLFTLAVLSDVADGVVARRLKIRDTQWLREADSRADTTLYAFVALCMFRAFPQTLDRWKGPLLCMLVSHFLQWGTALWKYGKLASYHSWTAKLWGVSLGMATGFLFTFEYEGLLWCCVICGIVNNVHEICISLVLPEWTYDVWDLWTALQLRKEQQKHQDANAERVKQR